MFLASGAGAESWRQHLPGFLNGGILQRDTGRGGGGAAFKTVHMTTSPSSRRKNTFCKHSLLSKPRAFVSLSLGFRSGLFWPAAGRLCTRNAKQLASLCVHFVRLKKTKRGRARNLIRLKRRVIYAILACVVRGWGRGGH